MINWGLIRPPLRRRFSRRLPPPDVRVHRTADDRSRPHNRDFDGEVLEIPRPAPPDHLDLRAALDLKEPDRVAGADAVVDRGILEIDAREIGRCACPARDELDAFLHERQHAEREEVDLDEARVVAGILVPLADDAVFHRGALERDQLDERARGDNHAAGMLRDMAWQTADLMSELAQLLPERRIFAAGKTGKVLQLVR